MCTPTKLNRLSVSILISVTPTGLLAEETEEQERNNQYEMNGSRDLIGNGYSPPGINPDNDDQDQRREGGREHRVRRGKLEWELD